MHTKGKKPTEPVTPSGQSDGYEFLTLTSSLEDQTSFEALLRGDHEHFQYTHSNEPHGAIPDTDRSNELVSKMKQHQKNRIHGPLNQPASNRASGTSSSASRQSGPPADRDFAGKGRSPIVEDDEDPTEHQGSKGNEARRRS